MKLCINTEPMTVYLDSANWDDLAEGRVLGGPFEHAVQDGRVVPVLSAIHLFELSRRDKLFRQHVASYVDRINEMQRIRWIKNLATAIETELQSGFLSVLNISPIAVQVFADNLVDTIPIVLQKGLGLMQETGASASWWNFGRSKNLCKDTKSFVHLIRCLISLD